MSKIKKSVSLVLALLMLISVFTVAPLTANAETFTSGDYEYEVLEDGTAEITRYYGSAPELNIPSELDGYAVTSIRYSAFRECESLTSVTIPDGITSIGSDAFSLCVNLKQVSIPKSVISIENGAFYCRNLISIDVDENNEKYSSIDGNLYNKEKTLIIQYAIGKTDVEFSIPSSVKEIGDNAFYSCEYLENVIFPESVTDIGFQAFSYCTNLKRLTLPNSLSYIGSVAFSSCTSLETVFISSGVNYMSSSDYYGDNIFEGCTNLVSITVDPDNENYCSVDGNLYNKDKTELVQYAVGKSETDFSIPSGVEKIGPSAFNSAYSLKTVTIPDSVTQIINRAFEHCKNLESLTIPDSVESIGKYAFFDCSNLSSVTVGKGIKKIEEYSLGYFADIYGYSPLDSFTIYGYTNSAAEDYANQNSFKFVSIGEISTYEYRVLEGNTAEITGLNNYSITDLIIPDTIEGYMVIGIGASAFSNCRDLTSVTVPDTVLEIGEDAFAHCSGLTSVTIGNGVTSIGESAFWQCWSLEELTLGESITSIGCSAFWDCENLTSVTIPDSVTSIGEKAFYGCASLTSITIPYSVTDIGDHAFGYDLDWETYETIKIDNFTIKGYTGSATEKYANDNGFTFESIGEIPTNPTSTTEPTFETQMTEPTSATEPTQATEPTETQPTSQQPTTPAPKLNKTKASVKAGGTVTLKVTNGTVKTWSTSNKAVATVSKGKVTGLKKGTATITAKLSTGKKLTCKVTVTTSPKLSKSSVSVKKGKTVSVKITGKASTVKNVYTNTKIAKVTSKNTATTIKVKGLKKGSTTLKIKVNGVVLKLKVKVK